MKWKPKTIHAANPLNSGEPLCEIWIRGSGERVTFDIAQVSCRACRGLVRRSPQLHNALAARHREARR